MLGHILDLAPNEELVCQLLGISKSRKIGPHINASRLGKSLLIPGDLRPDQFTVIDSAEVHCKNPVRCFVGSPQCRIVDVRDPLNSVCDHLDLRVHAGHAGRIVEHSIGAVTYHRIRPAHCLRSRTETNLQKLKPRLGQFLFLCLGRCNQTQQQYQN